MFNFKRKSEQQIVTEIHNEFDTAEDRLLKEADGLLTELNLMTEEKMQAKANRLIALGFVNSQPVKWVSQNSLVKTREQAELIRYYKQTYPFQKFLTIGELDRICSKYNLVYANASNYLKDVPEKNITEIEKSPLLNSSDLPQIRLIIKTTSTYYEASKEKVEDIILTDKDAIKYNNITFDSGKWDLVNKVDCEMRGIESPTSSDYRIMAHSCTKENYDGLFIAAPKSHFDLKGLKKTGLFSFMKVQITEVKDPIVFRYVRGGVQVLSKWGLEGEDKDLVNEKLN